MAVARFNTRSGLPGTPHTRQFLIIAIGLIWATISITIGYYVGAPYLRQRDDAKEVRSALREHEMRQTNPAIIADAHPPLDNDASPETLVAVLKSMRQNDEALILHLHKEIAQLRMWTAIGWIASAVASGLAILMFGLWTQHIAKQARRQLDQMAQRQTDEAPRAAAAPTRTETPQPQPPSQSPWPASDENDESEIDAEAIHSLTASLRHSRESICQSKIELENRTSAEFAAGNNDWAA